MLDYCELFNPIWKIDRPLKETLKLLKNSQYRRIILFFYTLSALMLIGVLLELSFSYFYEMKRARSDADNLSQVFQTQIEGVFKKIDLVMHDTVRVLESRPNLERWSRTELLQLVGEGKAYIPEAQNFFVLGPDGIDKLRTKNGVPYNFSDRDYFYKQVISTGNKLIFSRPLVSRETGKMVVVLSRKLVGKNNEFLGIVGAAVPLTFFSEFYSKLNLLPDSAITISSSENVLYSRYPWTEKYIGSTILSPETVTELFYKNKRVFATERKSRIDGIKRITSSRKVGDYGFFVVVALSKLEYLKGWFFKCAVYFASFIMLFVFAMNFLVRSLRALSDLEEQRKLVVQKAKLTSLGEMAGGVAHEINNPLAIISVKIGLLIKAIEKDQYEPEEFKKSLQKIGQTTERIAKIVRSLKTFSRTNEHDPFVPTPLRDIIDQTLEICQEKFKNSPVSLSVENIPDVKINCRESQIVQVLLNLLSNALDAVEKLENKWIEISVKQINEETVVIRITDSGYGIPENVASNIMQPFFTTKDVGKGTGLGLSISKGIIDDHNGKIYLDKESPNTCFVIEMAVVG